MRQLQQLSLYQTSANQLLAILNRRLDQLEPIRVLSRNIYCQTYPSYKPLPNADQIEQLQELRTFQKHLASIFVKLQH